MSKKRKKQQDWDDWDDAPDVSDLQPEVEVAKVSLSDFKIDEKVTAFVNTYVPAPQGMDDTSEYVETFDHARLRSYFKAYVCGLGDPLKLYIDDLKMKGFRMQVSVTGKPCIFAIRKA
jgi:hypothetical protein